MLEIARKGFLSNHYLVRQDGDIVARLRRSRWRTRGEIRAGEQVCKLRKLGAFRSRYPDKQLKSGDAVLGSIRLKGVLGKRAQPDLPEELPVMVESRS